MQDCFMAFNCFRVQSAKRPAMSHSIERIVKVPQGQWVGRTILAKAKVRLRGSQVPEVTLETAFAKTLLITLPSVFIVASATNTTRMIRSAYSVRLCPASSR